MIIREQTIVLWLVACVLIVAAVIHYSYKVEGEAQDRCRELGGLVLPGPTWRCALPCEARQ